MEKISNELSDNTAKLNKKDYIIMGIMVVIYAIISFYRLGSPTAPKTYYSFKDIDDSIVVNLGHKTRISRIVYWTGSNIGKINVMVSLDDKNYSQFNEITTYNVLSWEENSLYTEASSIKFVANSYDVTLGDIALYDFEGNRIIISIDNNNPLLDETDLVPNSISFMNSLYFDEIYHARCAYEYVNGIDCFEWSHPPLGKVIMTLPLQLFGFSPFAVRFMGNLAGILLIPVMYILCKKIFKNRKYALLGAALMMFDNMHFAHTRIALVDSFEVLFILLSVIFMKNYLDLDKKAAFKKKTINLLLSGFFIGCAIATKWNASYVAIGLAIVFFIHLAREYNFNVINFIKKKYGIITIVKYILEFVLIPIALYYLFYLYFSKNFSHVLLIIYLILLFNYFLFKFVLILIKDKYLGKLFIVCVIGFILIPFIVYVLSYAIYPNIAYYDRSFTGIFDIGKMMYDYHSGLVATHPFSSNWYSWPIMYKPVWIYSGNVINNTRSTIVDIGNPAIWWFGIISFVYVLISAIKKNKDSLFILIFILASYVPYIFIGRIMFMYHYFITLPFVMLGIVSFIKWITEKYKTDKIYWLYMILIIFVFFIFYPVTSGLRVSEDYINAIKWFSSWFF